MKRHPVLQKLSEDHHHGLLQARHLKGTTPATIGGRTRAFLSAWRREIAPHFQEEELALLPYVCPPVEPQHPAIVEMLGQHIRIRRLVLDLQRAHAVEDLDACLTLAHQIGEKLDEHIRHEERHVFEVIQEALSEDEIGRLGEYLAAWEGAAGSCRID